MKSLTFQLIVALVIKIRVLLDNHLDIEQVSKDMLRDINEIYQYNAIIETYVHSLSTYKKKKDKNVDIEFNNWNAEGLIKIISFGTIDKRIKRIK